MRIAVNTRLLLPDKLEGIGWFAQETLSRITTAHPEHEFLFLFDRPFDQRFVFAPNVRPIVVPPPTRHPMLYRLWFQHMLPRAVRAHGAELFLSPDGFLSTRLGIPQIPVIHDLNFEHFPDDLPGSYGRYYRTWFPRFARIAARIVTVSEYSKNDIIARYGVEAERIDVAHNGVGGIFSPLSGEERSAARARLTEGAPYFVCVGAMHRRKNIARLFAAFDAFAENHADMRLVMVGERMFHDRRMEDTLNGMRHKDRVIFTGRSDRKALREALGGALALAFVSYFEGFGIPVVEAMKCGVPVVAARATSLPEVAGDAAVYCDPFQVESITLALERIHGDAVLRERCIALGLQRAETFTWERTAHVLWSSVEQVFNGAR